MKLSWVIGLICITTFHSISHAEPEIKCQSCEVMHPQSSVRSTTALSNGATRKICNMCLIAAPRCTICKVPAAKRHTVGADGRMFCPDDFQAGIFEEREAENIAYETTRELTRLFWRFNMKFPETNVTISIVDGRSLATRLGISYNPQQFDVMGLTMTEFFNDKGKKLTLSKVIKVDPKAKLTYKHRIFLINGLPRNRMIATCAHELGHTWLNENVSFERLTDMSRDSVEGFCELIAYQLMESRYEDFEKQVIKDNLYTRGQQNILIETDLWYGFYKILQWFDSGTVGRLNDPDLIRRISDNPASVTTAAAMSWPAPAPIQMAESIMLKGITGTGARRLALVNNVNLMQGEEARIKLAGTNVFVQCLQIRDTSVLLRLDGGEEKEFFLKSEGSLEAKP